MARDIRGQDLSITLTNAAGAPVTSLSRGVESFSSKPITTKIEANNLDGRRIGQTFNGWQGNLSLNLRDNTEALQFVDVYLDMLQSGEEFRVAITEKVFDPSLQTRKSWIYPKCVLEFDIGEYTKTNPVKLKITWETGENRVPM